MRAPPSSSSGPAATVVFDTTASATKPNCAPLHRFIAGNIHISRNWSFRHRGFFRNCRLYRRFFRLSILHYFLVFILL